MDFAGGYCELQGGLPTDCAFARRVSMLSMGGKCWLERMEEVEVVGSSVADGAKRGPAAATPG